jgi:FkbM family methyltransferase
MSALAAGLIAACIVAALALGLALWLFAQVGSRVLRIEELERAIGPFRVRNTLWSPRGWEFYGLSLNFGHSDLLQAVVGSLHDPEEIRTALALARRGERVLVAGGGLGGTSLLLAAYLGIRSVVTYEANPSLASLARDNVGNPGHQLIFRNAAVSTYTGEIELHLTQHWAMSSVNREMAEHHGITGSVRVPCVDINEALRTERCTGMLLDIEGGEHEILPHLDFELLRFLAVELHGSPPEIALAREQIARHMTVVMEARREPGVVILGAERA